MKFSSRIIRSIFTTTAAISAIALAGCSGPDSGETSATGMPQAWIDKTADGWPDSDGYNANMPVLTRDKCELASKPPQVLGEVAKFTSTGWGGYGDNKDGYRYICDFHKSGVYAGQLLFIQADTAENAQFAVDEFVNQPSSEVQDNTVETVESGALTMHVLSRWYPTNPQGRYDALYHDEATDTIAVLSVNSLDEEQYENTSPQEIADTLLHVLSVG